MPVPSPRSSSVTHAQDVRRLRDLLRAAISGGRFPDGRVPGEGELMVGFGASRSTVREALGLLAAEGVVRGTSSRYEQATYEVAGFVPTPPAPPVLRAVDPSVEPVGSRVLDRSGLAAPAPLAAWLDVGPGSPCLRIEFLVLHHGVPSAVETHYVVHPEAGDLIGIPMRGSWETLLDDAGLRRGRTDTWGGRIPADPAVAELLGVAPGSDLVGVEQTTFDPSGRVLDGAVLRIRSDVPRAGTLRPAG
ncbi:GntR family transcriptional regulator [Pseudonocardia sediminis]|uniref:GntR family transcriptional regulator n=1 Tax=Pseudonocardia sediminis TaxID=1397368 RepID=A0A4Q7UQD5_PSEST|nr:GntR family transcriptional regulator [Pseudonocardia sediminis]RZT83997.1 GntR family transcriptional regulator [Pseudonocardia sediminis]